MSRVFSGQDPALLSSEQFKTPFWVFKLLLQGPDQLICD